MLNVSGIIIQHGGLLISIVVYKLMRMLELDSAVGVLILMC